MAICNNCGAQLPEDGKFCTTCGAKVEEAKAAAPATAPATEEKTSAYAAPVQKEKKPVNKKLFIIIGAAVAALILVIVAIVVVSSIVKTNKAIKEKTVKLDEEYFDITFSGYEGYNVSMDIEFTDEFEKDVAKALGFSKKQASKDKAQKKIKDFKYALNFEYEGLDEVSNGDELKIKVSLVEDYDSKEKLEYVTDSAKKKDKKEADIIVKEIELTVAVEGLSTVVKYNPFDDLEVTTGGADGKVWVDWDYEGEYYLYYYNFECDNDYNLSIGDSYTISVSETTVDDMLEYYGVLLTETSKTYKVDSADKYIDDIDDISDALLSDMQGMAVDEIEDEYYWTDCEISDLEYLGMYLMTLKEGEYDYDNVALLVYKGTATPDDDEYDPLTVYVGCKFYDLFETTDGEQSVDTWCYAFGNYKYIADDSWDDFYGFFTLEDLETKAYNDFEDTYDIAASDSLSLYEEEEEEEEVVEGEYDSIQAYFESEEGEEFVLEQEDYLIGLYEDSYSEISFTAEDNKVIYEYTFIEEQDPAAFEDLLTVEDCEEDFEEWTTRTGIEELSIEIIYYNPDGTTLYDETFSNF